MYISSDTNVWIDFQHIGHLEHPFLLEFQFCISRDTFNDEFLRPATMKEDLLNYGLRLVDATQEEFMEALNLQARYSSLSIYDAFALAIAKLRGWILLTGDMPLRKAATIEGVEHHGTIWIYDQLKTQEKIANAEYNNAIEKLIEAVKNGRCRLPLAELKKRRMDPIS